MKQKKVKINRNSELPHLGCSCNTGRRGGQAGGSSARGAYIGALEHMNEQFDESSLNEAAITDVETARLALRWALDKIRAAQEDALRAKQNLQDRTAQTAFLESQLKGKNSELEKIRRSHEEELAARQDSLEYQFRSRLERLTEREKELEDRASRQEEVLKQKETRLLDDYQKKSDELRARWAQVEAELWKLRQEQMAKQQEYETLYAAKLEDERRRAAAEIESMRAGFEITYAGRLADLEKRESASSEELKKHEAMLKWAKDSFQAETAEREKALKQKELDLDGTLMEKDKELEYLNMKAGLLQKQISELPETMRKRDEELDRYKQAIESLESVIRILEEERKSFQAEADGKLAILNESLQAEKSRCRELEAELPKRLKIAVEQERGRLTEKLSEAENGYSEDLRKRREECVRLEKSVRALEENVKTLQAEREALAHKVSSLQTQYDMKTEEFSFREKQLDSEYDVRLKVELEKKTSALKNELESAYRIYEDNLRLKAEEIAHLRRELEAALNEKLAFQTQAAEARRAVDAAKAEAETERAALRAQLKSAHERQLSDELAAAGIRQAAEKKKQTEAFEEQVRNVRLEVTRKEDEGHRLRAELARQAEEKKSALAEERQKGKAELQSQAASFSDTVRIYEDKTIQFNKVIESLKAEREERVLLERERLERLYSEKEKDLDERLVRKEQEAVRLRAEAAGLRGEYENILSEAARIKEQEAARAAKLLSEKDREMETLRRTKDAQEDAYRRTLEDFRAKLSEAVSRIEALKKASDEREERADALQTELDELRSSSSRERAELAARLESGEDALARELKELKEVLGRREDELERSRARSEELEASVSRLKEETRRRTELDSASAASRDVRIKNLEAENAWLRRLSQEHEQSKKIIEQLKEKLDKAE